MKLFRMVLLGLLFSTALITQVSAAPIEDYDFQQERMKLTPDSVMVISTFDSEDHVTAYTYAGVRLWNVPFHAKILSWQIAGDYVFIFLKTVKGQKLTLPVLTDILEHPFGKSLKYFHLNGKYSPFACERAILLISHVLT